MRGSQGQLDVRCVTVVSPETPADGESFSETTYVFLEYLQYMAAAATVIVRCEHATKPNR